jgi:hypothetical protein
LGQPQDRLVEVGTHNLALWPDEGGHPQRHGAAAASDVLTLIGERDVPRALQ